MLVGMQSMIAAQFTAQAAYDAAIHAVVQSTTSGSRNAAVLEIADRDLGELPHAVIEKLGLQTLVRRVLISAERQRHAINRRQVASKADADLVALRLTEAVANARYCLLSQRDARIFQIVGYVPSDDECLLLLLKLVPATDAKTKQDEWWVQTAYPFGAKRFIEANARGRLIELQAGRLPSDYRIELQRRL
jgi:hypothetical protein